MAEAVYLVPLRRTVVRPAELAALAWYLRDLARRLPVVVADGSPARVRERHAAAWGPGVRTVVVPPPAPGTNGKVTGVRVGLAATTQPLVVVADDDVRYDAAALDRVLAALEHADLVVPQNVFVPAPWHARWDTARSLVNRALGHDYAGTVALRRTALGAAGYDARVLFENLELERTVRARGGRVTHAPGLFVERRPPEVRRFAEQRVRQAYDSLAQPPRLLAELALAPLLLTSAVAATRRGRTGRRGRAALALVLGGAVLLAEVGRRRAGGTARFPATAALWAPAWVLERGLCAWLAVGRALSGGMPYAGTRVRTAAHTVGRLRREIFRQGCPDRPRGTIVNE